VQAAQDNADAAAGVLYAGDQNRALNNVNRLSGNNAADNIQYGINQSILDRNTSAAGRQAGYITNGYNNAVSTIGNRVSQLGVNRNATRRQYGLIDADRADLRRAGVDLQADRRDVDAARGDLMYDQRDLMGTRRDLDATRRDQRAQNAANIVSLNRGNRDAQIAAFSDVMANQNVSSMTAAQAQGARQQLGLDLAANTRQYGANERQYGANIRDLGSQVRGNARQNRGLDANIRQIGGQVRDLAQQGRGLNERRAGVTDQMRMYDLQGNQLRTDRNDLDNTHRENMASAADSLYTSQQRGYSNSAQQSQANNNFLYDFTDNQIAGDEATSQRNQYAVDNYGQYRQDEIDRRTDAINAWEERQRRRQQAADRASNNRRNAGRRRGGYNAGNAIGRQGRG